jgi:hypothetical protein
MIASPHGIFVDRDGNVWVTDCMCTVGGGGGGGRGRGGRGADSGAAAPQQQAAADPAKGHQVYKFSADGMLLMTLGKAGGGRGAEYFFQPNDVLVAPNGDIYVSEGHSSSDGSPARVLKFDNPAAAFSVLVVAIVFVVVGLISWVLRIFRGRGMPTMSLLGG